MDADEEDDDDEEVERDDEEPFARAQRVMACSTMAAIAPRRPPGPVEELEEDEELLEELDELEAVATERRVGDRGGPPRYMSVSSVSSSRDVLAGAGGENRTSVKAVGSWRGGPEGAWDGERYMVAVGRARAQRQSCMDWDCLLRGNAVYV